MPMMRLHKNGYVIELPVDSKLPSALEALKVFFGEEPQRGGGESDAELGIPPIGEDHRFTWTENAWKELNRPATIMEMYRVAVSLGYNPDATDPKGAFNKAVRDNPRFKRVGRARSNRGVLYVVAELWKQASGKTTPQDQDNQPRI